MKRWKDLINNIKNLTNMVNVNKDGTYSFDSFINRKNHLVTINNPSKFSEKELQDIINEAVEKIWG